MKLTQIMNENQENRPLSNEVKKHFLEIVSTYNKYQESLDRKSDIQEIAETLGGITEAARTLAIHEGDDWFDKQTIKRNMSELDKLGKQFDKCAVEAKALDQRLGGLYEDMGHILSRYYKMGEITEEQMKERLGMNESVGCGCGGTTEGGCGCGTHTHESVNESASKEAMGIAALTGTRGSAVQDFIDKNRINSKKLFRALKSANLQGRMNFASALSGKPGNPNEKLTIKLFGESVNEGVSVFDERHFGKKGIIIMIDDNGKKVSAIFKDKKNADKYNRNNPSDIKKLLDLAKKTKYPNAIDESVNEEEELTKFGESVEKLMEKNVPTNPSKWSYYKAQAKKKFDVYPSAYANGWAAKQYKAAGGGWKKGKSESVNEVELKLGVKYVNKQGKEGFIQTGGSKNPKDWFWFDGKTKHPYDKVKKELKPSKDQKKTGFGDYLKQGGRVWDNVNPTNSPSVNEAKFGYKDSTASYINKHKDEYKQAEKMNNGNEKKFYDMLQQMEEKVGHGKTMLFISNALRGYGVDMFKDPKIKNPQDAQEALFLLSK